MTAAQKLEQQINETGNFQQYEYLTVPCSTRSSKIAKQCARLLSKGKYAEALKKGDPIAWQVALNEIKRK